MERRDLLKMFAAVPALLAARTVESAPSTQLVKLANGKDMALLRPASMEQVKCMFDECGEIQVTGVSGAILETNVGPIALKPHQFPPIHMRLKDNLSLTWFTKFSVEQNEYNQTVGHYLD